MSRRERWTGSCPAPVGPDGMPNVPALRADQMGVAYQPIVDAQTGRLFAYEVLARCREPAYKNPATLFSKAVEQHACGRLGRLIREVAFAGCTDRPLFINLHPTELESRWLVRPDDPMVVHSQEVFLEITESAAFQHFELCRDVLTEVCERVGAHLVVDDFGAGYSNLLRVLELEPAIVKLDGALVRGLNENRKKQSLVAHMVALCADLGARVVAECVETVEELQAIQDTGASFVQGYLTGKPADPPPSVTWPLASVDKGPSVKLAALRRSNPAAQARRRGSSPPRPPSKRPTKRVR